METTSTILIVDDETDFLENLSLTLEMAGYRTVTAGNGIEALAEMQRQPVDLIVCDIKMPLMGGYQFHEEVRANPNQADIPFLFLSGCRFLTDAEIRRGKRLGVTEYFAKPIRVETLLLAVWSALENSPQVNVSLEKQLPADSTGSFSWKGSFAAIT